ncbi:hypothetical protein AYI69_g7166 [Smittium culicis]|uniref:Uncharacterized protein n=1 Tax=Smittium culicis TaxID=133412 RepID=A0A1R1XTX7_9FUNG|nr:hypothetical protein AYI69_g7166 [Smittium culicis]
MNGDFATGCSSEVRVRPSQAHTSAGQSGMCPYAFFQCPEGPASSPDTYLEGQPSCLFSLFCGPPSTGG